MTMSEAEFLKELSKYEGIEVNGEVVKGIRLLTDAERAERIQNTDTIRFAICEACGADDRDCSASCTLMRRRLAERIAAMCPVGVNLRAIKKRRR